MMLLSRHSHTVIRLLIALCRIASLTQVVERLSSKVSHVVWDGQTTICVSSSSARRSVDVLLSHCTVLLCCVLLCDRGR